MALITCPECGKEISELAVQCPYCGCPSNKWQNVVEIKECHLDVPVKMPSEHTIQPKNSGSEIKEFNAKVLIVVGAVVAFIFIIAYFFNRPSNSNVVMSDPAPIDKVQDSIRQAEAERRVQEQLHKQHVKDSIQEAEKQKAIKRYKSLFRESHDEFSNCTWVEPVTAPKYRNRNATYCYFSKIGSHASNFRFVFQYTADSWLFIDKLIFNIDGANYTIEPEHWKHDNNTTIWEWCDESVRAKAEYGGTGLDEDFIKALSQAKSVKVRMDGSQYTKTRSMTASQIKSIKDTYEYFKALNGTFR